jgi:hypothetical protein
MCLNFPLQKLLPIRRWLQPKVWPVRRFRRSGWPGRYRRKQRDGTALKNNEVKLKFWPSVMNSNGLFYIPRLGQCRAVWLHDHILRK